MQFDRFSFNLGDLEIELRYVVMDTTSEFIKGPKAETDRINHQLGFTVHATLGFTIDCNEIDRLQLVEFLSGPTSVSFKPVHYVRKNEHGECYSAFRDVGTQYDFWVFGIPAHMDKYVLYNEADKKISFGKAECGEVE
ncbi:hypothetical protein CRM22_006364 [Opisthorchis felineus]|uniref:Peptidase A1 domain-containing protein n=1 Tax=Opisthorchis felineus TaxID=147828 RepID=A0A4S2LLA7_OPIFE|nr:hypothetical protein CRM22_006364 [Opisthorchis felineus]